MTTSRKPPPDTRCLVHMNISFGSLKLEFMLTIFKGFTANWFYLGFGVCECVGCVGVCAYYCQTLKMDKSWYLKQQNSTGHLYAYAIQYSL